MPAREKDLTNHVEKEENLLISPKLLK